MTDSHRSVRGEPLGLPDRRAMRHAVEAAREHLAAGGVAAAVLLVEVAGLASAGERPAAELASRLAAQLHADDLVGCSGGDVLFVVTRDAPDEGAAHALAARLAELCSCSDDGFPRLATAGFTLVRDGDLTVAAVLARADAALYAAKNKASRDARGVAPGPFEERRDVRVEAAFECSTVEDFDVYYQPIVDLRDGSIAAVEAILRWEHPDLGTIAPSEFLGIVDRRGQMVTLGRWTIEKACAQTIRWGATRDGLPMRTCVNVGGAQIADPSFVDEVVSALDRHGAMGHQLAFELTEEALAGITGELQATLANARLALVLDHAGTHSPSRAGLERVPLSMIKLDRSLLDEDRRDDPASGLRAAAQLARSLGVPCVAKGVETREQLRSARDCGVPFAQGYLFTRPQSAAAIEELVFRERPFGSLLAPPPMLLGLEFDGDEPAIELGAPAVP